ncbi:4120_t:CDS:2, partial [Racocetra fulgida]
RLEKESNTLAKEENNIKERDVSAMLSDRRFNEKLGYHSQNEGDTESDPSVSNTDEFVVRYESAGHHLPRILEPSIFGFQPTNDITKVVGDFLYNHVGREYVEVTMI